MVEDAPAAKPAEFVGSSRTDIRKFPEDVREVFGYAIYLAQSGDKHPRAKPLKGFVGAGVLEIVDDYDGDTYRAVYTVRFAGVVYILHAFQKKSKKGKAMPQPDMAVIKAAVEGSQGSLCTSLRERNDLNGARAPGSR